MKDNEYIYKLSNTGRPRVTYLIKTVNNNHG